jgi:P27 family predicted phage terminase small subunit
MGGRGRTPRPTHLRALEGVKEYRLNRDEPIPSEGQVVPPVSLPANAQAVWDRLAPDMIARRTLTAWDVDEFANACRIQALLNRALLEAETLPLIANGSNDNLVMNPAIRIVTSLEASLRSIWSRFGLTPGDRATLRIDDSGPKTGNEGYVL